jgi:glycosyltransferase involved in cell wall biosynthesis
MPSVCIVTPAHLTCNPRVVKEADALHQAGFQVDVVFAQRGSDVMCESDRLLTEGRGWKSSPIRIPTREHRRVNWFVMTAAQRSLRLLPNVVWDLGFVAERSEGRAFGALARAATSRKADLYVGHYVEGLAAAAVAARHSNGRLGFDSEDLHTGEGENPAEIARVDFIQRRYLPQCQYVSAASEGIGTVLSREYGVSEPVTIHNCFPISERLLLDEETQDRRGEGLSLYWYSQVIGLDRGIQDAIRAMAMLGGAMELHLRGRLDSETRIALESLATQVGVQSRVHFHSPVPPQQLLSRAVEHDVGLALEQGVTLNRAICTTNKLFFYMLAGLAIAATNVQGQVHVLSTIPEAASLYSPGDAQALASILKLWQNSAETLRKAKHASLDAALQRWNWELEGTRLVNAVTRSLTKVATKSSQRIGSGAERRRRKISPGTPRSFASDDGRHSPMHNE